MAVKSFLIANSVIKQSKKLPRPIRDRLVTSFSAIHKDPIKGVKLHGELKNYYKYRIGDYRIVYSFDSKASIVVVVKIEHRQGVYK